MLRWALNIRTIKRLSKAIFASYPATATTQHFSKARLLALFMLPTTAVMWWYYSVAMSVAAMMPQLSATTSADAITIEPQAVSELLSDVSTHSPSTLHTTVNSSPDTADVRINGQAIPVPDNGEVHKTIKDDNGQTKVDISVQSNTSGSRESRSSTSFRLESSTEVSTEITKDMENEVR